MSTNHRTHQSRLGRGRLRFQTRAVLLAALFVAPATVAPAGVPDTDPRFDRIKGLAGNQPRMKATPADDPSVIRFEFAGATNLSSPNDMHMHNAVIRWLDADHIQSTWISYQDGKPVGDAGFDLHRKK